MRHIEDCSQGIMDSQLPIIIHPTVSERVILNRGIVDTRKSEIRHSM